MPERMAFWTDFVKCRLGPDRLAGKRQIHTQELVANGPKRAGLCRGKEHRQGRHAVDKKGQKVRRLARGAEVNRRRGLQCL
jgi:hypothetical protein